MPEKQTPETPPELDPQLREHETGERGLYDSYEQRESDDESTATDTGTAGPDMMPEGLADPEGEYSESDEEGTGVSKSKKKKSTKRARAKERMRTRKINVVKSLADIFAQSRKKPKHYKDRLKASFEEGKRKARADREARHSRIKRRSRIIDAIKHSRAIKRNRHKE